MKKSILFLLLAFIWSAPVLSAADTLYMKVAQMGVRGDGKKDDFKALTKVFSKAARADRPVKIVFEAGRIYRIGAHNEDKYGRLVLKNARNVVVEGNGCTFLLHPSSRLFGIYGCDDVTFRNFKIDYAPLPYTQGRITAINDAEGWLEFKAEKGYPLPVVADESYYNDGKLSDIICIDGRTEKFYNVHSKVNMVSETADSTYRVDYTRTATWTFAMARPGDIFILKREYPHHNGYVDDFETDPAVSGESYGGANGNILCSRCKNLVLENITSHAAPLMTLNQRNCSGSIIRRFRIEAAEGRVVAGNSDGMHISSSPVQPLIEDCYIERTIDDAIHVKITSDRIQKVLAPDKIKIRNTPGGTTDIRAGRTVMIYNSKGQSEIAKVKIKEYTPFNNKEGIAVLEHPVPEMKAGHYLFIQPETELVIRNCRFGTQLQRAILTHQYAHIDHCVIEDNGWGIVMVLSSRNIEGPATQRLRVTDTRFSNLTRGGIQILCPSRNYDQKGDPQLIVEDCSFDFPHPVPVLRVRKSKGILFKNNKVDYTSGAPVREQIFDLDDTPLQEMNTHN